MSKYILKILFFDLFLIEFGPTLIFFIVYELTDFFLAALSLAISTLIALVTSKVINQRLPYFALFSGSFAILVSLLTFILKMPDILIIEDSIYYFLFVALLSYSLLGKKIILKKFFGHIFLITDQAWRTLEFRWLIYFVLALIGNEYFRIFTTEEIWVRYKQAAFFGFLIFGLYQFTLSARTRLPGTNKLGVKNSS